MDESLVLFLYLLMRDHLPTGKVASILDDCEKAIMNSGPVVYTNKDLENMANRYAMRLA